MRTFGHGQARARIVMPNGASSMYKTHDTIQGYLRLCFEENTFLNKVSIMLEGETRVYLNNISNFLYYGGNIAGRHTFLRIAQPVLLPHDKIAFAGKDYDFPFSFTVPERLLPYACHHTRAEEDMLDNEHLCLPPSLGSFENEDLCLQDLGPSTSEVIYKICARIRDTNRSGTTTQTESVVRVTIIPTANSGYNWSVNTSNFYSDMREVESTYSVPFGGKLSIKSMPMLLDMKSPCSTEEHPTTMNLSLNLRFEPRDEGQSPPQLISMKLKLRCCTFQGRIPYKTLPQLCEHLEMNPKYTHDVATINLLNYKLDTVAWAKNEADTKSPSIELPKYTSISKFANSKLARARKELLNEKSNDHNLPFYTACVSTSVALTTLVSKQRKTTLLIPTFSSCMVARAYSIEVDIAYKVQYASSAMQALQRISFTSSLKLNIPLQIRLESKSAPTLPDEILQDHAHWRQQHTAHCREDADESGSNHSVEIPDLPAYAPRL